jgi:hypothetical protein
MVTINTVTLKYVASNTKLIKDRNVEIIPEKRITRLFFLVISIDRHKYEGNE